MMRFFLLTLLILTFTGPVCHAAVGVPEYQHEIILHGMDGSVTFGGGSTLIAAGGGFASNVGAGYEYLVGSGVQLGIFPAWLHAASSGTTADALALLGGATINFPLDGDLGDAFFLTARAGFLYAKADTISSTNFAWGGEVGKKFRLADHVSYRPSFSIQKVSGSDMTFSITVLSFSVLF